MLSYATTIYYFIITRPEIVYSFRMLYSEFKLTIRYLLVQFISFSFTVFQFPERFIRVTYQETLVTSYLVVCISRILYTVKRNRIQFKF